MYTFPKFKAYFRHSVSVFWTHTKITERIDSYLFTLFSASLMLVHFHVCLGPLLFNVAGSVPNEIIGFFNWPNPSSRTMALGSTQSLTEMSTRNLPGGNGRPARKANNLTAISEPIV
jgi:hypothetical protein